MPNHRSYAREDDRTTCVPCGCNKMTKICLTDSLLVILFVGHATIRGRGSLAERCPKYISPEESRERKAPG